MITTSVRPPADADEAIPGRRTISRWLSAREEVPDNADLRRLRFYFLLLLLAMCVTAVPLVAFGSASSTRRIIALGSILFLASRCAWGYRRGFRLPLDALEAAAIFAVGITLGHETVLGILYATSFFRSLYDSWQRAMSRVLMFLGAFLAIILVSRHPESAGDRITHVITFLLTCWVMQLMAITLRKHGRALKRERTLRQLAMELGRAHDNATMRASVIAALLTLGDDDPTTRVAIAMGNTDEMTFVAAAGRNADAIRDRRCSLGKVPAPLLGALCANRAVRLTAEEAAAAFLGFTTKKHLLVIPLTMTNDLVGVLVIGADNALPAELDEVVTTLGSQVSMWLEGQESSSRMRTADRERASLLRHLVIAQEDERRIIAGDIHDDSIQEMAAVAIRLGMLRKFLDDAHALETLTKIEDSVANSIGRLRRLMFSLRPPALDEAGLAPALREQLSATAEECGFKWTLTSDIVVEPAIEIRVQAFRIAQEAIANVRKHAEAKNVSIEIKATDGGIAVQVADDGIGFAPEGLRQEVGHLGITSMRERAELTGGRYSIASQPGHGTIVDYWIPEPPPVKEQAA